MAGASSVPAPNEKVPADLSFLGNLITAHAMNRFSRYSMPARASSENPLEMWGTVAASRITVFEKRRCLRMDSGGECRDEIWADSRSERNVRLQFQGKSVHHNRLHGDGRFVGRATLDEVQFWPNPILNHSGFSAYQTVFGPNAVDSYSRQDTDAESDFV